MKVTVPVSGPTLPGLPVTVAVKVTVSPAAAGVSDDVSVVVVVSLFTVTLAVFDTLPANWALPWKLARMVCGEEATARNGGGTVSVATPELFTVTGAWLTPSML